MKKSTMNAVTLRGVLGTIIVLVILLAGVGFYFTQGWLHTLAVSVSHKIADSNNSDSSIQSLNKLQQELSTRQDIISKTNAIMTSSSTYQTQAVQDLTVYATAAGIKISNYAFPVATVTSAAATVPLTQVTVTLQSPVAYTDLLEFMTAIEGNLPKMQITSVNLGRITSDASAVKIDQLTVAVYTR